MSRAESKQRRSGATSLSCLTTQIAREQPTRWAMPYLARGVPQLALAQALAGTRLADSPAICRTRADPRVKSDIVTNVHLIGPDPK
jgi:hypothetical protein